MGKPFAQAIKAAGARRGATPFVTLLTGLKALIVRLSGQHDIVVGTPAAGQSLYEDAAPVGHFVNFLPIRTAMEPSGSFADNLSAVKQSAMNAFDHQAFTFGTLVRRLNTPRTPNRTPLTDIQFNLEKLGQGIVFKDLATSMRPNAKAAVNFDLFFNFIDGDEGLRIDVDFNSDLYDRETIGRWVVNLRTLFESILADADGDLNRLNIVGPEERVWLLAHAGKSRSINASVITAFDATAQRAPHAPALLSGPGSPDGAAPVTYQTLQKAARRQARAIQAHSVRRGDVVAILAGRSPETIRAILSVLNCEATYLAIEPSYPVDRIDFILRDSGARLLLTEEAYLEQLSTLAAPPPVVDLRSLAQQAEGLSDAPLVSAGRPDDAACIMYTSGSTGRPKGAVVTHRAMVNLVTNQNFGQLDASTVMLHLASLSFDASTYEVWGPLLNGGAVAIIGAAKPGLSDIARAITDCKATTAWFTAALFNAIIDEEPSALAPLKLILTGGDVLSPAHIRRAHAALPDVTIINGYGPTENTTFTCCYPLPRSGWGGGAAPIGQPISGAEVYICDARGELAPKGVVGELYAGGAGVARGYLNRTDLTAERFVTGIFAEAKGARLYRTGDQARWRADGLIEFLGRVDNQVKINGYRVELEEIEAAAKTVDGVGDAVVIATTLAGGDKTLVAFVTATPRADSASLVATVSANLSRSLPSHMLPRTITLLPQFPRTSNNKVDRAALLRLVEATPATIQTPVIQSTAPEAPMTSVQKQIADCWASVIGLEHVGLHDRIFELGADSLQIFRITARLAQQGITVEARSLMRNPSIAELSAALDDAQSTAATETARAPSLSDFRHGAMRNRGAS